MIFTFYLMNAEYFTGELFFEYLLLHMVILLLSPPSVEREMRGVRQCVTRRLHDEIYVAYQH